jgi:hypothetical protein
MLLIAAVFLTRPLTAFAAASLSRPPCLVNGIHLATSQELACLAVSALLVGAEPVLEMLCLHESRPKDLADARIVVARFGGRAAARADVSDYDTHLVRSEVKVERDADNWRGQKEKSSVAIFSSRKSDRVGNIGNFKKRKRRRVQCW